MRRERVWSEGQGVGLWRDGVGLRIPVIEGIAGRKGSNQWLIFSMLLLFFDVM